MVATAGRQQQQEESEHNVEVDLEPYSSSSHNYSDYLATVYSPIPAEDLEPSSFQASTLLQEEHVAPAAATLTKLMTTRRVDDGTMSDDVSMKSGSAKTRGEEVGSMTSSTKKRRRRGSHVSFSASALLIPPASSSSLSQAIVPVPVSAGESGALPTTNRQEQEQNIMRTLSESFTEMKGWVMEYRKTLFHLKVCVVISFVVDLVETNYGIYLVVISCSLLIQYDRLATLPTFGMSSVGHLHWRRGLGLTGCMRWEDCEAVRTLPRVVDLHHSRVFLTQVTRPHKR